MTITVQAPNGSLIEFPDGTTPEQIKSAMGNGGTSRFMDVLKAIPSGLAKSAVAAGGMIGDLHALGINGLDWAGSKAGINPRGAFVNFSEMQRDAMSQLPFGMSGVPFIVSGAPTSQHLRQDLEKNITGPLYEPKTTPGQYADTISQFAPAAIGGGGSMLARAARVFAPAVASETAGQATKGTEYEPFARGAGALAGGGGTIALQGLMKPTLPGMTSKYASSILERAAQNNAGALQSAGQMGDDAMLLNAAPEMTGLAQGVVTRPGAGGDVVLRALEQQQLGTPERLNSALKQNFGTAYDADLLRSHMAQTGKELSDPMYAAAKSNAPLLPDKLDDIIAPQLTYAALNQSLSGRASMKSIMDQVDDALKAGDPAVTANRLHNIRQQIDAQIVYDKSALAVLPSADKAAQGVLREARGTVDDILKNRIPGFEEADATAASYKQFNDYVTRGEDAAQKVLNPGVLRQELSNMDEIQRRAFIMGDRSQMERVFGTRSNELQALRQRIGADGLDWQRQNTEALYGKQPADDMGRVLNSESKMRADFQDIARNSKTATKQEFSKLFEHEVKPIDTGTTATGMALRAGQKAMTGVYNALVRMGSKTAQEDIAKALVLKGKERDEFITKLFNRAAMSQPAAPTLAKSAIFANEPERPIRDRNGRKIRNPKRNQARGHSFPPLIVN